MKIKINRLCEHQHRCIRLNANNLLICARLSRGNPTTIDTKNNHSETVITRPETSKKMCIRRCTWCSSSKFRHVIRRQTSRNSARSRLTSWTASSKVRARCETLNARPGTSSRRSTSRKCRSTSSKSSRWDRMRPRASKWSRRPMRSFRSCRRSETSSSKI